MDVRRVVESLVRNAVERQAAEWGIPGSISWSVEVPKNPEHGDYSTNAALQSARAGGRKPRESAERLAESIRDGDRDGLFRSVVVAGPGFVNLTLSEEAWRSVLSAALAEGERFGSAPAGSAGRVLVEFVSANPTGPLHVGHGRGAAVGDSLARILAFRGHGVETEYYVNDVGNQMERLGESLYLRYLQECGRPVPFPEDGYRGDYLVEIARRVRREEGDRYLEASREEALPAFREIACERILEGIRRDLEDFGVRFDRWIRERDLHRRDAVRQTVDELARRGQCYESEGAVFFRSGEGGDEKDRVLVRADGRSTYFAADIAYHREKLDRGYDRLVDIWGADHHGYQQRVRAALRGLGEDPDRLEILLIQFVTLVRDGKAVSMSTRSGEFTTLREVVEEVGRDAARFFYLQRGHNAHLDFDLTLAKTRSSENPVYYIQYVHARICSIFREADSRGIRVDPSPRLAVLALPDEIALVKSIARFPDVVSEAARLREVQRVPFYLLDLAREFHAFYHNHRFLDESPERTQARLAIAAAVRDIVRSGLRLIGVSAPERM